MVELYEFKEKYLVLHFSYLLLTINKTNLFGWILLWCAF